MADAPKILGTDTLRTAYPKLNQAIDKANKADKDSAEALSTANTALANSENTQTQLDTIVIEGDSSVEAAQARVSSTGTTYTTLKERLDQEHGKITADLAQTEKEVIKTAIESRHSYYDGTIVSFSFDDGTTADWTRFKPIFESEGVPGCACLVTNLVGSDGRMTWEQAKELKKLGWTVASHTHTHKQNALQPEEVVDFEFKESSRLMRKHGLDWDIIVYPFGSVNDMVERIAQRYYKMGVHITTGGINKPPYINNYTIARVPGLSQGSPRPTLQECKDLIDRADNEWVIFEDHSAYDDWKDPAKLEELRELIQYIKSKGIPIVNFQDGYNMKGNVLDFQSEPSNFKLFRDGNTSVGILDKYSYNSDTPISYFPYGVLNTFFSSLQIANKGFPTGQAGTVTTVRPYNSIFRDDADLGSHQTFRLYRTHDVYKRVWMGSAGWSEWEFVANDYDVKSLNAHRSTDPITEFAENKITVFPYNTYRSAGFPTDSGIVTTYRFSYGNGWNKQECREYYGDRLWTRHMQSDGTWSEWVEYVLAPNINLWAGVVDMFINYRQLGQVKIMNYIDFEKLESFGGITPNLTKTLWHIDEISTDSSNPTIVSDGSIDDSIYLQIYRNSENFVFIRYSASGNNYPMYVKVVYF